jgi:argininosuccinate lyase
MGEDYLGRGGRLASGPAPELVAAGFAAEVADGVRLARGLSLSDLAHAVALAEGGAIGADVARALADALLELHAIPPAEFPWDPEVGDAFNSRERELHRRAGAPASGWLSAGRPRREALRVALRLTARAATLELHEATLDVAEALVDQAEPRANALAADYTYLQAAQPTTIGHLLLSYAYPVLRDAERLRGAHAWLDLSVAGSGGSAGSRWPLDRERLAALLGCAGVVPHARDAMWQADGYVELTAAIAMGATHRAQLAQDLEIFASAEFGFVSLAEGHSRASALMPQKRNPYALAVVRAAAATAAGELAGLLVALHTGSARTDHFHALNGVVPRLLDGATASTRLAAAVVRGLQIDEERMARAAREGFTTAADVADLLAQRGGIDYRSAHTVVGRAVRALADEGLPPDALTPARLAAAAAEALDDDQAAGALDAAVLAEALDPEAAVRARAQAGSCAPAAMTALLADCRARLAEGRRLEAAARSRAASAEERLLAQAALLAGRAG